MTGQLKIKDQYGDHYVIEDGILISEMGEQIPVVLDDSVMKHHRFHAMSPKEMQQAEDAGTLYAWDE